MYGFVYAAAEVGVEFTIKGNLQIRDVDSRFVCLSKPIHFSLSSLLFSQLSPKISTFTPIFTRLSDAKTSHIPMIHMGRIWWPYDYAPGKKVCDFSLLF